MSGVAILLTAYGLLLLGAIVALFGDMLPRTDETIALFGSFCAGAAAVVFAIAPETLTFGDKYFYGQIARFTSVGLCVLMVLWTMWISRRVEGWTRKAVALAFFSIIGASVLSAAQEFITFLVAFELLAMPSFILVGYSSHHRRGLEAALKYFLFSVMASMIMTYGISLIYAATGTTFIPQIDLSGVGPIGILGLMMLMIGLFTKVAAAPFHFWAPDAYSGSFAWTLAFVGTVVKAGASVAFILIVWHLFDQSEVLALVLAVIAVLSMVLGSFAALVQTNIHRILSYSGVVNAGYMMVALVAIEQVGEQAVIAALIFTFVYALAVMGVLFIIATEGDQLSDLAGLSKRRPVAAWGLVLFSLSLIGVPPLVGFFGKLFVFMAGISSPYWIIVVLATVASAISAF
ncbi:MAG: hypothetical protein FWE87_05835, partial [Coriobacteriia bacterium]|nr:hypothetical protein [Coriobacteriia bacterium]